MTNYIRWLAQTAIISATLISTGTSRAQEVQVKPWFLIIADTSTSMTETGTINKDNSCGFTNLRTKLSHAKCAINRLVNGVGDATFGLTQFYQNASCTGASGTCTSASCGKMLVNLQEDNQASILTYVDGSGSCGSELVGNGWTPLQGSLVLARDYFCQGSSGASPACGTALSSPYIPPTKSDSAVTSACRPMSVILLTDGDETCCGNYNCPSAGCCSPPTGVIGAATNLHTTRIPVSNSQLITKNIRTYVIGFGINQGDGDIEDIGEAGCTCDGVYSPNSCAADTDRITPCDPCGGLCTTGYRGYYASDEESLSLAFSRIIADSQLIEKCNGIDDDCDGLIDEGFNVGAACAAGIGACRQTGTIQCDTTDANRLKTVCNAVPNSPGVEQDPVAHCKDSIDNDCDGVTDCLDSDCADLPICGCIPQPEICDNLDNNCNGEIDEGLTRPCSVNVGECTSGIETCTAGVWGGCTGTQPSAEICDNKDNDCDGVTDGFTRPCNTSDAGIVNVGVGECQGGLQLCTAGDWSDCTAVGPSAEICDNKDNDCDGKTDEGQDGNPLARPCSTVCGDGTESCIAGGWDLCSAPQPNADGFCETTTDNCQDFAETPCGSSVGECRPGTNYCDPATGQVTCVGGKGPSDEICDGLDNDCNGLIDDGIGLGDLCGTDEGECKAGRYECVNAKWICVGAIGPTKEICDCLDNDCDGLTDETDQGPLCEGDSICYDCQCVAPCTQTPEFRDICPAGKSGLYLDNDKCYCVAERCKADQCSTQTITLSNETLCEPRGANTGACVCKNNQCTFPCDGTVCTSGLVCDPRDGACRESSCMIFGCEQDQRCDPVLRTCESDPCATAGCAADQGCRDGACFSSCEYVSCDSGTKCVDGQCEKDLCASVSCSDNRACNPTSGSCQDNKCIGVYCAEGFVCETFTGDCLPDPCLEMRCPSGQSCQDNACILRCHSHEIQCAHTCVDPLSNLEYCGATGDCSGANIGVACAIGQVCANGVCAEQCPTGQIECGGICVDPTTSNDFCGAKDDCQVDNSGEKCVEGQVCLNGVCSDHCESGLITCNGACIDPLTDPSFCGASGDCSAGLEGRKCNSGESCRFGKCVAVGGNSSVDAIKPTDIVTAAGGGGCACAVTSGARPSDSTRGTWAVGFLLVGLLSLRNRKRFFWSVLRQTRKRLDFCLVRLNVISIVILASVFSLTGCHVKTFCFDCENKTSSEAGVWSDGGQGQTQRDGQTGFADGAVLSDGGRDGDSENAEGGIPVGCVGADLNTDIYNCGACGNACVFSHAFSECIDGQCRMKSCDVDFLDLDNDPSNGCEYYCKPKASDDILCNHADDECDGLTDEDVDLQNDINNCGQCGLVCNLAHATNGSSCQGGVCVLDGTKCDEGFYDVDGKDQNGCEYKCTPSSSNIELCNLVDDDCDGIIDEDATQDKNNNNVSVSDSHIGQTCGHENKGECKSGLTACVGGQTSCVGSVGPSFEVCDSKDNDCDGETDESFNLQNDVTNCGSCGHVCSYPNAIAKCQNAECSLMACRSGYWNDPDQSGPNCLYQCDYSGQEICNGKDDDCNKKSDDNLTAPPSFCRTAGVCGVGGAVQPTCGGSTGWVCDYSGKANYQAVETACDGLDNNCNELVDDPYTSFIGQSCSVTGTGDNASCHTSGTWKCYADALTCLASNNQPVPPPTRQQEVCNGIDDDCDNQTDEPCASPTTGADTGCVHDAWVKIPGYSNIYTYAYEASRPDAKTDAAGALNTRACSAANRIPWTNITYAQAKSACEAANGRLCKEAEWEAACSYSSSTIGDCSWSYSDDSSHNCRTYAATTCNGNDYNNGNDNVSSTNPGTDKILPTGSLSSCYREQNTAKIYDLSGNVKEWVQARESGVNPLRGGAMNSTKDGIRCDFDFTVADDNFLFFNAGFRCCYGN